ncbi:MAG: MGMT family protein [Candidatus Omnitrophota bacterium]|jgi:methylated-DNA-[protein]-cysteine S-methyltransferase
MNDFTKRVYRVVSRIPLGQVRSYKWVARRAGSPGASRAVGQALKRNPYPLIIPCHRVVKDNAEPGGYAYGAKRKIALLKLEKRLVECLSSKE